MMGDAGKEMTIREATIFTLEQSVEEFKKINESLKEASSCFEEGKDSEGLSLIATEIIPKVKNLFEFCDTIINMFNDVLGETLLDVFAKKYFALEDIMNALVDETS